MTDTFATTFLKYYNPKPDVPKNWNSETTRSYTKLNFNNQYNIVQKTIKSEQAFGLHLYFRELAGLSMLKQHPNICQLLSWHTPVFYMHKYFCTLSDMIELDATRQQTIPQEKKYKWILQIANALLWIHKLGIIHHDINPDNIFYDQKTKDVFVGDFGAIKFCSDGTFSSPLKTIEMGTPGYAPPEGNSFGCTQVTPQYDVYSFGLIIIGLFASCIAPEQLFQKLSNKSIFLNDEQQFLKSMISPNQENRPNMETVWGTLTDQQTFKSNLQLSNKELIDKLNSISRESLLSSHPLTNNEEQSLIQNIFRKKEKIEIFSIIAVFQNLARGGSKDASHWLSVFYKEGIGFPKSIFYSIQYEEPSLDSALNTKGTGSVGFNVPEDLVAAAIYEKKKQFIEAVETYLELAKKNDFSQEGPSTEAYSRLGQLLKKTHPDFAQRCLRIAIEHGDPYAAFANGDFEKANELGHPRALLYKANQTLSQVSTRNMTVETPEVRDLLVAWNTYGQIEAYQFLSPSPDAFVKKYLQGGITNF